LREFIESLNAADARYVVVGGYAVAFHGHPRFTGDIDFFVEPSPENGSRITEAILRFGFAGTGLKGADFEEPDSVIRLGRPPYRIDLLTSIDDVSFEQAWEERIEASLDGIPAYILSKSLLLKNKRAADRAQDRADVVKLTDEAD
jgi:hypothetical protein